LAIESSRKRTPASGAVGSWLVPAALLLALAAASWPLVVPGRVLVTDDGFVSDATGAGLPFRAVLGEALRGRSSLFWCPGIYCGYPLHADPEAGFFYPPNWLLACLGDPIGGIHLGLFAHLLVAAAGLLLVLRDGGVPAGPATYGALAFGGGGFLLAHLKHVSMVHTTAWLPWLLAGAARMRRPEAARSGFALAAVSAAGMGLASHPQLAYIGILAVAAFHVLGEIIPGEDGRQRKARPGWRAAARPSVLLLAALIAGLAAAAVQIVPAAFLALGSERAAQRGAFFAERIPLEPRNLLTWFAARAVGMPGEGTYEGRGLHWEDYSYQGLLTIPFALAGLERNRRRSAEGGNSFSS
jgi:hypothetical protein